MRTSKARRANILITVLWIIVVLAILVLGLSYEARLDIERTGMNRDRAQAYWLARAAVEQVKFDYAQSKLQPILEAGEDPNTRRVRYRFDFDNGFAECVIINQTSKFSVNSKDRDGWGQLLRFYGLDDQQVDHIIDAILDWTDPNDMPGLNGAEADYYLGLSPPYIPRNGNFMSVEEIMLVRGITETMYYGVPGPEGVPGLKDLLTTDAGNMNRFDLNTAPEGILRAFLEISAEEAQMIIRAREQQAFTNVAEALDYIEDINGNINKFFMLMDNTRFTIKATAFVYDSPARYTVEDQVQYTGGAQLFLTTSHMDFSLDHVDEMGMEEEGL